MEFRPLHDRVLVRRLDEDEVSVGGIIIPDTAKEKPMEGDVLAVGRARATIRASLFRSTSSRVIGSYLENGRGTKSRSTAKSW